MTSPTRHAASAARFLWQAVTWAVLFAVIALALALLVIPKLVGGVPLTILTGSMRPTIEPGSKIVVQPIDPDDVRIGHIVTFQPVSGDPTLITHRVISVVTGSDGERQFITQGDNNGEADEPIVDGQIKGRVLYSVPYFGLMSDRLHNGTGPTYIRWAAFALIAYGAVLFLRGFRRDADGDEEGANDPTAVPNGHDAPAAVKQDDPDDLLLASVRQYVNTRERVS